MKIINLFGAPGAGKTTFATGLFSKLKQNGYKVSYISEVATDFIETGQEYLLGNSQYQLLVTATSIRKILDQEKLGTELLISDSPLVLQLQYVDPTHYMYEPLQTIIGKFNEQYKTYNYFIERTKPYLQYKRVTTESESDVIGKRLESLDIYDLKTTGDDEGILEVHAHLYINYAITI
jgi:GTPase SAR1 family protein